jgi:membrane protein implicated in regulation of membrane protease activity
MTHLAAAGPGVILVLVVWAAWYLLDPPLRSEGVSWARLVIWLFAPLGLYLFLARHREPPSTMGSPVGKEGTIASLHPLEVEVFGSFWHARSKTAPDLRVGERVRVVERAGLTLIVDRIS